MSKLEWTLVSEPPTHEEFVLVAVKKYTQELPTRVTLGWYKEDRVHGEHRWFEHYGRPLQSTLEEATHWAELPSPPAAK